MKTLPRLLVLAALCAAAALPARAATITMTGAGTTANASGNVEFSIGADDAFGQRSLFLAPVGTPGWSDIVFTYQWYENWLWLGFLMPETGLPGRTFSHFVGRDYEQSWTVNRTHSPRQGQTDNSAQLKVAFTDGAIATMSLSSTINWAWDGSTLTGTMPWTIATQLPTPTPAPVSDRGATASLLAGALGLALLGRRHRRGTS